MDPGLQFSSIDKLRKWLAGRIEVMIDNNFQGLLNMLYRIDVDENKVKMAFSASEPADELAMLVIDRELQKAALRKKYRGE